MRAPAPTTSTTRSCRTSSNGRSAISGCDPTPWSSSAAPGKRETQRHVFSDSNRQAIIASAESLGDRLALRLFFDYGIRKGALRAVQFKHFDYQRRSLTIFTKGGKVRQMPIPHGAFWTDLE